MNTKIFIDGQYGTTGLNIYERLSDREDIDLLHIAEDDKKDPVVKKELMREADIVFLCLPDQAARESAALISGDNTRVIDASTAHRVNPEWVYGIPEISPTQREKIQTAKRVSVPGCHATGFVLTVRPLIEMGVIARDYPITAQSITGYSGGGKKLISLYQGEEDQDILQYPRHYALGLDHKHLPEMKEHTGLAFKPLFTPVVSNYYKGMVVSIPLFTRMMIKYTDPQSLHGVLSEYYQHEQFVEVMPLDSDAYLYNAGFKIGDINDTNKLEIFVFGHGEQILLLARLDNLGKGASGAAVQNMNIMMGVEETKGLV